MDDRLALHKALMLADRGDPAGAERTLRALLDGAPAGTVRVQALVVLGDLLAEHDAAAAREVLTEALAADLPDADDVLDDERARARELLDLLG
ncbi:hypothetical protein [Cellulomonas triticagri]|uniref:hypothetical protein n=1 Tax=Cellulomonas triticagri TaxID=2483352 RepID=UPI0013158F7A|nr:hypothetical protein [Cellulomonas triticagri]